MKFKRMMSGAFVAAAMVIGAAGSASALTFGSIPGGTQVNEGLLPVYGSATPRNGWYGADLYLVGGGGAASITVEFLGAEAGFVNSFNFGGGASEFSTNGVAGAWSAGAGSVTFNNVADGLLDFSFLSPLGTVTNGSNPDDAAGTVAGPNFFVSFANENASSGTSLVLWLDDGGAGSDDNHDDMAIRMTVRGGSIAVPLPAAAWLLLSALGGLGGLSLVGRRRMTAA